MVWISKFVVWISKCHRQDTMVDVETCNCMKSNCSIQTSYSLRSSFKPLHCKHLAITTNRPQPVQLYLSIPVVYMG